MPFPSVLPFTCQSLDPCSSSLVHNVLICRAGARFHRMQMLVSERNFLPNQLKDNDASVLRCFEGFSHFRGGYLGLFHVDVAIF